ncbi:MAG: TIR domain-containing protein [Acidimicrobiales bacterium]
MTTQREEGDMGGIFISYRREDAAAWAGRVWEHLKGAFGSARVFMDVDSLNLGEDFLEVIERYIAATDVMLVVIGPRWLDAVNGEGQRRLDLDDDFVALEIAQALEQGRRVIPVLVDNASMPTAEQLPARLGPLARRHAIGLTHSGFSRDIQGLIDALSPFLSEGSSPLEAAPGEAVADRVQATHGPPSSAGSGLPPREPMPPGDVPPWEPLYHRPRRRGRRLVWAAVGTVGVLFVMAMIWGDDDVADDDEIADGPCAAVDMAVSPEKLELLTDLANTFNTSDRAQVDDSCVEVVPYRQASGLGARLLVEGWDEAAEGPKPVIWSPASSAWGAIVDHRLDEKGKDPIAGKGTPFMRTPLVIAMPEPMAKALGWPEAPIGWSDVFELATNAEGWASRGHQEWGPFRLGKTNPNFSTSGLSALVAQSYAATGKTEGLTSDDLDEPGAVAFATGVESAVVHYGDTTLTFLDNLYRADGRGAALSYASAVAVEEKSVIDYNLGNPDGIADDGEKATKPRVPLVAIYPEEGTVMSDNPFFLLDAEWVSDLEREGAQRFEDFVQERPNQERVLEYGFRPGNPEVAVGSPITKENGVDPAEPALLSLPEPAVLADLVKHWDAQRKPARVELVIDISGSMRDTADFDSGATKLELAVDAALGAIDQFGPNDVVGLRVFSTKLGPTGDQDVVQLVAPGVVDEVQRGALKEALNGLVQPTNATPLYSATQQAFEDVTAAYDPGSINAVVLLSDGVNDDGEKTDDKAQLDELLRTLRGDEGAEAHPVRVFPIIYGSEADRGTLRLIAEASDSAFYDAEDASKIDRVLAAVISNF